MARARKKKKEVVLTKENLLIQPMALTLRGINPTVIGNRVTIVIERKLKEAFKEIISSHKQGKDWKQLSIFATEEVKNNYLGDNKLVFDIHMGDIVSDPKHYQDAFNAVCKIADVMVWAPIANEHGEVTMARTPLFTLLAKSNMEKSISEKTGEVVYRYSKHSRPEIGLVMEKAVAEYLFTMQEGYSDFLDYPALEATDKYYFPIYAFLSHHKKDNPSEIVIDYAEFRRRLGFEDIVKDGNITYVGYDVFSQFAKRVLRPTMEEMKENAECNISDIWFEFEKIYLNGRAKNPDKLKFTIHLSELGKSIMSDKNSTKEVMEIERRLRDEFRQTTKQVKVIMKHITTEVRHLFIKKMNELSAARKSGKVKIDSDENAYWNVAFTNYLEKVKSEKKSEEPTLFEDIQEQAVQSVGDKPSYDAELWKSVWKSLAEENSGAVIYEDAIKIVEVNDSAVVISYPSRTTYEMVSREFGTLIQDRIGEVFAREVEVTIKN